MFVNNSLSKPYPTKPTKQQIQLDKKYRDWISRQPSCIDGDWHQIEDSGEGRSICCHVRRIKHGSGMGYKPLFSCVPMSQAQHDLQGREDGERKVLDLYLVAHFDNEQAAEWFEQKAQYYLEKWINETGHNPFFYPEHQGTIKTPQEYMRAE